MIPHHANSVNTPFPFVFSAWRLKPRLVTVGHNHLFTMMSSPSYRAEDEFQERLNAEKLKELYAKNDYRGLLEFALLLNHQASFNNSRAAWAIGEAMKNMSAEFSLDKYQKMVDDLA
jgi:hypothetical protein